MRPGGLERFFDGLLPRYADIGEKPVIKSEAPCADVVAPTPWQCWRQFWPAMKVEFARTIQGAGATETLFRCGSLKCKRCCRKACLTSITERDNAWPRKLIGRLSTARDHSSITPTSCTQAVGRCGTFDPVRILRRRHIAASPSHGDPVQALPALFWSEHMDGISLQLPVFLIATLAGPPYSRRCLSPSRVPESGPILSTVSPCFGQT